MKMNKYFAGAIAATAALALLSGCAAGAPAATDGKTVIKVAAFEGGYGRDMYLEVAKAYEAANPGTTIDLSVSKTIAEELTPQVASGDYPDLVVYALGGKTGFTDSFVRDKGLEDLTGVLDMTVPGETVTVRDKLTDGIVDNLGTNPYGDDKTYLMPMFASPTALVYNTGLFAEKGWTVPTTWDEMFALGDTAKAEGISLFTFPTTGYLDSYFFSMFATIGGEDFYQDVVTFKKDVWETPEAKQILDLTTKLLSYASPTTVGYANNQDFTKNQQAILDDTVLFMPNGSWIANEMKDAPRSADFAWGMTPVPALKAGDTRYVSTFIEAAWVPKGAANVEGAKEFIAYMYSDEAAAIFAKTNAIQPIKGLSDNLAGDAKVFYSAYDEPGVNALVGGFAATKPVPGVDIKAKLFDAANSIISGDTTEAQWQKSLNETSNKLTDQIAH